MRLFTKIMDKDDGSGGGGDSTRYVTVDQLKEFGKSLVQELRGGGQSFNQNPAQRGSTADRVRAKLLRDAKAERDAQQQTIDDLSTKMQTFEQAATDATAARKAAVDERALQTVIGQYIATELNAMKTDGYHFAQQSIEDHHFDNAFARISVDGRIDFSKNEEIEKAVKEYFVAERMALAPTQGGGSHAFAQAPAGSSAVSSNGNGTGHVTPAPTGNELVDKYRDNPAHFESATRAVQQFSAVAAEMEPGELTLEKFILMAVEDPTVVEVPGDPWLTD